MADDQYRQMLHIGSELQNGKYRIDRYLASGGFGNTYIATNQVLQATIVIKEFFIKGITSRLADSQVSVSIEENRPMWDKMLERFKREARHMYKINHPNIVRVHDLFEENGTAYYVMDLVDGESMRSRLERTHHPLSEAEVSQVVLPQVLNALDTIHTEHVWHLDLKPANLMMERGGLVKLIDFGASKQSDQGAGVTTTGLAFTPGYAAPEQVAQYTKAIGPWTDIYALGATVYNLLTGLNPPSQVDIDEEGDRAFDYSQVNVSQQMRGFIRRLMATRRSERPQSATAVRILLNQMIAQPHPATARIAKRTAGTSSPTGANLSRRTMAAAAPAIAPQRTPVNALKTETTPEPQVTPTSKHPQANALKATPSHEPKQTQANASQAKHMHTPEQTSASTPLAESAREPEVTIPVNDEDDTQPPRPIDDKNNYKKRYLVSAFIILLLIGLLFWVFAGNDDDKIVENNGNESQTESVAQLTGAEKANYEADVKYMKGPSTWNKSQINSERGRKVIQLMEAGDIDGLLKCEYYKENSTNGQINPHFLKIIDFLHTFTGEKRELAKRYIQKRAAGNTVALSQLAMNLDDVSTGRTTPSGDIDRSNVKTTTPTPIKAQNNKQDNSSIRNQHMVSPSSNNNGYNTRRTQQLNQSDVQGQHRGAADNADAARRQIQNMQQRQTVTAPTPSNNNRNVLDRHNSN